MIAIALSFTGESRLSVGIAMEEDDVDHPKNALATGNAPLKLVLVQSMGLESSGPSNTVVLTYIPIQVHPAGPTANGDLEMDGGNGCSSGVSLVRLITSKKCRTMSLTYFLRGE